MQWLGTSVIQRRHLQLALPAQGEGRLGSGVGKMEVSRAKAGSITPSAVRGCFYISVTSGSAKQQPST